MTWSSGISIVAVIPSGSVLSSSLQNFHKGPLLLFLDVKESKDSPMPVGASHPHETIPSPNQ